MTTSDLVFYYAPYTTAGITHDVLTVLGIPFDLVTLDLKAGHTKSPAYRALNPNGVVPLIVHHGTRIFESAAITIYLGETFGEKRGLFPPSGPKRGDALKWIVWGNVTLAAVAGRAEREPDNQAARESVAHTLTILDDALHEKPFLLGDDYSLVDTHVASILYWVRMINVADFAKLKNIARWSEACQKKVEEATKPSEGGVRKRAFDEENGEEKPEKRTKSD